MSRRKGERTWRQNERECPFIVEIEVPENGFGMTLNRMHEWHHAHGIRSLWGRTCRRQDRDFESWCFPSPELADAFCAEFGGKHIDLQL